MSETSWQLGTRPAESEQASPDLVEAQKRFGPNAQILSSARAGDGKERTFYFQDLPDELQKVLRVQLRQPGDVSGVVEMPSSFLLYLVIDRTAETLSAATLTIPKRSYDQWLDEQNESKP